MRKRREDSPVRCFPGEFYATVRVRTRLANGEVRLIIARDKAFYNQGKNNMLGFFIDVTPPAEEKPVKPVASRISRRPAS